jgi:hypothetical protein
MIKGLLHENTKSRTNTQITHLPTLNKKLAFYIYKKNFFLYKELKKTTPPIKFHEHTNNTWLSFLQSFAIKYRRRRFHMHHSFIRSFFYYKAKRKFRNVNNRNRVLFGFFFKNHIRENSLTRFYKATKNVRKLDLVRLESRLDRTNPNNMGSKYTTKYTRAAILGYKTICESTFKGLLPVPKPQLRVTYPHKSRVRRVRQRTTIRNKVFMRRRSSRQRMREYPHSEFVGGLVNRTTPQYWDFTDQRQLLTIKLRRCSKILEPISPKYYNLNLFSYRTYNWKVLC